MKRADLDWKNLGFGYLKTDYNIRYTWRDGKWSEGVLTADEQITLHMAATCLHYGQECSVEQVGQARGRVDGAVMHPQDPAPHFILDASDEHGQEDQCEYPGECPTKEEQDGGQPKLVGEKHQAEGEPIEDA